LDISPIDLIRKGLSHFGKNPFIGGRQ
jgi:hypothetical protein